jgi:hypothetical protein
MAHPSEYKYNQTCLRAFPPVEGLQHAFREVMPLEGVICDEINVWEKPFTMPLDSLFPQKDLPLDRFHCIWLDWRMILVGK